jgi:Ran GTPase-activating protein (RanGAP) involved in mRNA processing and transport
MWGCPPILVSHSACACPSWADDVAVLHDSHICMRSIESVATLLKSHPSLQEVRLVDTQLVDGSFRHFCQGLENSKTVQRLHLVNVELQEEDAAEIAALIAQDDCCLDELVLSENELGDKGVATLIQRGVLPNKSLRLLDLRSNGVTAEGALSLQGLLVSSRNIVSLQLGNNELDDHGASCLARGLQARTGSNIQDLDLTNNGLTAASCVAMGSMLRVNKSLTKLNLSFNAWFGHGKQHDTALVVITQEWNFKCRCQAYGRNASQHEWSQGTHLGQE